MFQTMVNLYLGNDTLIQWKWKLIRINLLGNNYVRTKAEGVLFHTRVTRVFPRCTAPTGISRPDVITSPCYFFLGYKLLNNNPLTIMYIDIAVAHTGDIRPNP